MNVVGGDRHISWPRNATVPVKTCNKGQKRNGGCSSLLQLDLQTIHREYLVFGQIKPYR